MTARRNVPWPEIAFVVLALGVLVWVAWDAFFFRLVTNSPGADYWEHTAVLHALLENPWHPAHPLIKSLVSSPRFGPHFVLIALLGRAVGVDALGAMSLAAVANTALFLAGIYLFFKEYFRNRWAPLFALVVTFGSWLDAPHFSNVYKLSIYFSVAGYPSSAALAVMLLGLTVVLRLLRSEHERPRLWLLSTFAWAYVYVTHPLTAMLAFTAAGLVALFEPGAARKRRLWVLGSLVAGILLASLWPYYPALGMVAGGTADRVKQGIEAGGHELHPFYAPEMIWNVLGAASLAILLVPYFLWRRTQLIVPLGAATMLGVFFTSTLFDIPLGHRFLLLSVFFLQIGLVWLLLELLPPRAPEATERPARRVLRIAGAVAAGLLLAFMGVGSVLDAKARFAREWRPPDTESGTVKYGRRVAELAGPNAIVLGDALLSWPLPTFGPKIVTLHHRNPLILDGAERDRAAARFFGPKTPDAERLEILERFQVTHVVVSQRQGGSVLRFLSTHGQKRGLPLGRTLYALSPEAGSRAIPR